MPTIGIDVSGTNTDAVIMNGARVVEWIKMNNSEDRTTGVTEALHQLLAKARVVADQIDAVMIGTTQFTNAVIHRRDLAEVAAVRLCLPSGQSLPLHGGLAGGSARISGKLLVHGTRWV